MTFLSNRFSFAPVTGLLLALTLAGCGDKGTDDPATPVTPVPPVPPVTTTSDVTAWLTTPDANGSRLTKQVAVINFQTTAGNAAAPLIEVDETQQFQVIDGFGAAVTGSSAYLLQRKMNATQREALLKELFTTDGNGIGLSYSRITIGSSDFSVGTYSYDDVPAGQNDPNLDHFSIEPDRADLVPTLQQIHTLSPELKLMGSPWSPPAWMKTTRNMIGGKLYPSAYSTYAQYFVKTVQAFAAENIALDAITVQNEPLFEPPGYPGMLMTATEQADFIKNHLGPAFAASSIATKIITYDHNWDHPEYPLTVLADAGAAQYVAGSAFHGYGGTVEQMGSVHASHPDKDLYFTEQSGGDWSPDFAVNLREMTRTLLIGTTRNWSRVVLLWNLALDENHGPRNGGCQDCRGVVTIYSATGAVTRNVEYYALGHVSKFVRPGAHRIASTDGGSQLPNVAFRNADGSKVMVMLNASSQSQSVRVRDKSRDKYFNYTLLPGAVVTLTWGA